MYTLVSHYQRPVLDEISGDGGPVFSLQERGAVAGSEEVKKRARVPCHTSESHPLLVIYAEAEGAESRSSSCRTFSKVNALVYLLDESNV